MSTIKISKMQADVGIETFDCGNASINSLIYKSCYPTVLQHAYAYVAQFEETIVGVYMLKFMKIDLSSCPEDISDYQSDICSDCFSIHIKYIAVSKDLQGQRLGSSLLALIIRYVRKLCEKWPVRLITLDALKDKVDWYKLFGFVPFNENDMEDNEPTIKMYLDCLLDPDLLNRYCSGIL